MRATVVGLVTPHLLRIVDLANEAEKGVTRPTTVALILLNPAFGRTLNLARLDPEFGLRVGVAIIAGASIEPAVAG